MIYNTERMAFCAGILAGALLTLAITLAVLGSRDIATEGAIQAMSNEAVRRGFGEFNNGNFVWEKAYDPTKLLIGTRDTLSTHAVEKRPESAEQETP